MLDVIIKFIKEVNKELIIKGDTINKIINGGIKTLAKILYYSEASKILIVSYNSPGVRVDLNNPTSLDELKSFIEGL